MSDTNITLRNATVADAEKLLEIYSYYVTDTAVTFEWEIPSLEEFQNRIQKITEKFPYIVAEENGKVVGYAYASTFRTRAAYQWAVETSIYLNKNCHRKGIGKMLLNELERRLKEQNFLNVYAVISYLEKEDEYLTHDSVNFHQKMGYTKVCEYNQCGYKFKRWYNIVQMEKFLGDHTSEPNPVIFKKQN